MRLSALALLLPCALAGVTNLAARKGSILADIKGFPPLPQLPTHSSLEARAAALNFSDIQGDILIGMRKQVEVFYFFKIATPATFKSVIKSFLYPILTSTAQLLSTSQPSALVNVGFSQKGISALSILDFLGDPHFLLGMAAEAAVLADPGGTAGWESEFKSTIHGVFLIASDTAAAVTAQVAAIEAAFGSSITKVYSLQGNVRPPPFNGHEFFGYLDGIGQPAVNGFNTPLPGQQKVDPGVIITGATGDTGLRPFSGWMTGGSFMAFRKLQQMVPEFDKYLLDNAPVVPSQPNWTIQQRADLLGARMIGRWKSGTPVDLAPLVDNATIGGDPNLNNNFDFTHPGSDITSDQSFCPFSAHIRKSRPRADQVAPANSIIRAGIPYGPEVTSAEATSNTTSTDRGLAFVAYQSSLVNGFTFIGPAWSNNPAFPLGKNLAPGYDPLVGEVPGGGTKSFAGMDAANPSNQLLMPTAFIVPRGGEYFFMPPISAIKSTIGK